MSLKSAVFVVHHHVSMVLDTGSPLAPPPPLPPPLHRKASTMHFVSFFISERLVDDQRDNATVTSSFSEPNKKRELLHGSAWPLPKHRFRHPLQSSRVGSGIAEDPKGWTNSLKETPAMEIRDESEETDDDSDNTSQDYVEGSSCSGVCTPNTPRNTQAWRIWMASQF
ncbi:hypothetical protein C4D60_Mb03t18820 [Musa balbisiana]|uniref:Uncharacterized protein n=1 Tax=Musa balbisiana TaxID=52838 RepID=A0A4S8JAZ8_MUSBA|nr:hypothetical protein C4D60_Mb03t18820 [Musa balbisiana]